MSQNIPELSYVFPNAVFTHQTTLRLKDLGSADSFRPELGWDRRTVFQAGSVNSGDTTYNVLIGPNIVGTRHIELLASATQFAGEVVSLEGVLADWNMPKRAAKTKSTDKDQEDVQLLQSHKADPTIPFLPFIREYLRPWRDQLEDQRFHLEHVVPKIEFIDVERFTAEYIEGMRTNRYFLERFLNTHSSQFAQFAIQNPNLFPFQFNPTQFNFQKAEGNYFGHQRLRNHDHRRPGLVRIFDAFIATVSQEEQQEMVLKELTSREQRVFADPTKPGRIWQEEELNGRPFFPDRSHHTLQYVQNGKYVCATITNPSGAQAEVWLHPQSRNGTYTVKGITYEPSAGDAPIDKHLGRVPVVVWEEKPTFAGNSLRRLLSPTEAQSVLGIEATNADYLLGRAAMAVLQPSTRRLIPAAQPLINPTTGRPSRPQEIRAAQVGVTLLTEDIQHSIEADSDNILGKVSRKLRRG